MERPVRPVLVLLLASAVILPGCKPAGCLGADDPTCTVPSACQALTFETCEGGFTEVRLFGTSDPIPNGISALVSPGDAVLTNDKLQLVIDGLDHPHYLAPTGGGMLDISTAGLDNDALRHSFSVIGLLPNDAPHYTQLRLIEDGDIKAVQVLGTLEDRPEIRIATRYEVRPCEPGIRVRTEVVNNGADPISAFLGDGWYYGDRENLPFTPFPGAGFEHPSFGLTDIDDVLREVPYMVAAARTGESSAYGVAACNEDSLNGFHSDIVSLVGLPKRILMPGDALIYERFVVAAPGTDVAAAADILLEVRSKLFDEPWTTLSGRVEVTGGDGVGLGDPGRVQLIISEGAAGGLRGDRVPWTHITPNEDGDFTVRVPSDRSYAVEASAFGRIVDTTFVDVGSSPKADLVIEIPAVGELTVDVLIDGERDEALVFLEPTRAEDIDPLTGDFLGHFGKCTPLLGHPHGGTPACNRLLVNGPTTVLVPPGTYDLYTIAGPFTSLGHAQAVVVPEGGTATADLSITTYEMLQPEGTLSGDFHVHGGQSFDSGFPNEDRVRSFIAARTQVLATTEHSSMADYARMIEEIGASDRIAVMDGTESTGAILFNMFDEASFPKVFGHWNIWPIPHDSFGPWRGAPWDQLAQPGELFDRAVSQGWDAETGVAQLNHPWGGFQFGRDFGWAETLGLNLNDPLPDAYDGSGQSTFRRRPEGASFANDAYHVQEVMNGSANAGFLPYRAVWFYVLSEGLVRGGTANSDTHSLTENVTGIPMNLVWTDTTVADFDPVDFNAAVRDGRMIGTNGPVILASMKDADNNTRRPSLDVFEPGGATVLELEVRAAPWVPIEEVRILVNGEVVRSLRSELATPQSDDDSASILRLDTSIDISDALPATGDAWIVIEAGAPLVGHADLDCNGVPDTTDNNADGAIDWRDVEDLLEDPEVECLTTVGPLAEPVPPERGQRGHSFSVVVPGGHPMSFTNPFLLDLDGNGYQGVAR